MCSECVDSNPGRCTAYLRQTFFYGSSQPLEYNVLIVSRKVHTCLQLLYSSTGISQPPSMIRGLGCRHHQIPNQNSTQAEYLQPISLLYWSVPAELYSIFNQSNTTLLSDNCIRLHVSATVGHHQAFSVTSPNYVCLYNFWDLNSFTMDVLVKILMIKSWVHLLIKLKYLM
jgi:hypothetical protein